MYIECRHILPSGHKCRAAALRGKAFCYYHIASRRLARMNPTSDDPVTLPSIEDAPGVQTALNEVFNQCLTRRISPQEAKVILYGLQIASGLARKLPTDQKPGDTVRDVCEDPEEGMIAPETTACEPPDDCVNCPTRDSCKNSQKKQTVPDYMYDLQRLAEL